MGGFPDIKEFYNSDPSHICKPGWIPGIEQIDGGVYRMAGRTEPLYGTGDMHKKLRRERFRIN